MRAILDTHTFIWSADAPHRLSATVRGYLRDPACTVYLSVASVWEMVIKVGNGKLQLSAPVPQIVAEQMQANNRLVLLPIGYDHTIEVANLPLVHRDPFDRMLAAQSRIENAVLLTDDAIFQQYPVRTDW